MFNSTVFKIKVFLHMLRKTMLRFTLVEVYLLKTDNVMFQGELYIFDTSIFISPTLLSPRFQFAIVEVM